ncbi:MAG TPA: S8 family serine peptidase [Candidatus Binatia bacterium]|nr:S8 family serine peptidase [Candidatus Binatia bacterium]
MTIRKLLFSAVLAGFCAVLVQPGWSSDPTDKIATRVLSETANGASTEALVVLSRQADLSPAYNLPTKAEKGQFVVNTLRSVAQSTQGPILAMLQQRGVPYQSFFIVNMIKVTGDRSLMEALASRDDVARIDANPYVRTALPSGSGSNTGFQTQGIEWNVQRVHAPDVWNLGYHGEGLVVAGADTGVQWDHPALINHYRGWNGQQADHDYNWDDAVDHTTSPSDPNSHGTFTVSEMVGDDGQGNQIGVAPGAKWIACRNMDANGTGSPSRYTECFQFMIAPWPINDPQHGDPTKAPDSINNSWVCPPSEGCDYSTLQSIVDAVRAAGIVPAMAAGNDGPACSTIEYPPAIYASSVTVGALDSSNNIASFSSRGPVTVDGSHRTKPDVSAPGENIRGAVPGNGYSSGWSGTSMAAPHVAGGVTLIWQAKPSLVGNVGSTEFLLEHTAQHLVSLQAFGFCLGPSFLQDNTFGYGLINLLQAVQAH